MKDFLRKLKLSDELTVKLQISKHDFVSKLNEQVDYGSTNIMSGIFEAFSSSDNDFVGTVNQHEFQLRRRKRFFEYNSNFAIAKGFYEQQGETLLVHSKIIGFHNIMIVFYVFIIMIYGIFAISIMTMGDGAGIGLFLPFLIIHATFMLGIPYFVMRRSVKKMKRELEKEFYFMTKN